MSGKVLTYSPKDVTLIIAGFTVAGMISVSISWNKPQFMSVKGAYGKTTRVKSWDTSAVLKVELLQTAIANGIFSDLVNLDAETNGGRLEMTLQDLSGNSLIFSDDVYLTSLADIRYSDDFDNRVWTFNMDSTGERYVESNEKSVGDLLSTVGDKVSAGLDSLSSLF